MKRVVMFAHTTMTLITCVYYGAKVKERDRNIRTVLIWENSSSYSISLKPFSVYFDEMYTVSAHIGDGERFSMESIVKDMEWRSYLRKSDVGDMLGEPCEREILMLGSDYFHIMKNIIRIFCAKKNAHQVVLFEEGLLLYDENKGSIKEKIAYKLGKNENELSIIGKSSKIDVIFARKPQELPEWKQKNRRIIAQSDVFSDDKIFTKMLYADQHLRQLSERLKDKKVILYLGQPIWELSKTFRFQTERNLIDHLVQALPEGYVVLMKGHPRESANKYRRYASDPRCAVFDKSSGWYPIECLLQLFTIKAVMACASSAALNVAERIDGCRAVYTYPCLDVKIPDNWSTMFEGAGDKVVILKNLDAIQQVFTTPENEELMAKKERTGKDVSYLMWYLGRTNGTK